MATGTVKSTVPVVPPREAERFIERQLGKTRRRVRMVDLAAALMSLAAGLLGYLLLLAVVDHWLFELTPSLRWLAWLPMLAGTGWYLVRRVIPLLLRPIHPLYAAKAIEEATPTLKNSLINFLFFHTDRGAVNEVVYDALEQRAAADLHDVTLEHAVDRSQVIIVGYVLAGLLALGALYKILSPKDPFPSASRVAAPWANIQRPSRVQILDVQPGDATVFQGEHVTISAAVRGNIDAVTLYYSTTDGEIDNLSMAMQAAPGGLRFECRFPMAEEGVQREVLYRIEAGDARTPNYRLQVSPAPHIVVQKLEYDFPDYTRRPHQTLEDQGDISALEGTRVTIHARANQPIRSAYLELDPAADSRQRLPMEFDGQQATRTLVLELQADRRTPKHPSYQVRFVTGSGHENRQPVLHRIEVTPDLPPEVEILTPAKETVEVPLDGVQVLEFRALDPDFGLSSLRLRAVAGGTELLDESLFDEPAGTVGQIVKEYRFRPAAFDLQPGDQVIYRAVAADNRADPNSLSPAPNLARTKDYQLLITPPRGRSQRSSEAAGQANNEAQDAGRNDEAGPGGDGSSNQSKQGGSQSAESGGEKGGETSQPQSGEGAKSDQPGQGQQGSSADQNGQASPEQGPDGQAGSGQPQAGQDGGGASAGNQASQQGDERGGQGASTQPSQVEPLHDGEVFEKALERLKQELQEGGGTGKGQSASSETTQEPSDAGEPQETGGNDGPVQGNSRGDAGTGSSQQKFRSGDERNSSKQQAEPRTAGEGARHEDNNLGAGAQRQAAPGEGGTSKKPDRPTGRNGAEPDDGDEREPPGPKDMRQKDPGSGDSGDSGAGQNSEETTGTGAVEAVDTNNDGQQEPVENRDRPKSQQPDSSEPQPKDDPGFTKDKRQSDSQGGASGDRSGGGNKGPGQGANQAGNDSAGQNNAADEGAGKATEAGNGETSSAPGQKERAEGATGSSGNERGNGSSVDNDPTGSNTGDTPQTSQPPSGQTPSDPRQENRPDSSGGGPQSGGSGVATGGGLPPDTDTPSGVAKYLDVPPGDEANLEYARRATNLVLEYLKDQKDAPNRELLQDLGWTPEELKSFLQRWQQLKQSAAEDAAGARELDASLRSLGLQPQRDRRRQGREQNDEQRGLRDAGAASTPPAAYQDLFDAFKKGTARVQP